MILPRLTTTFISATRSDHMSSQTSSDLLTSAAALAEEVGSYRPGVFQGDLLRCVARPHAPSTTVRSRPPRFTSSIARSARMSTVSSNALLSRRRIASNRRPRHTPGGEEFALLDVMSKLDGAPMAERVRLAIGERAERGECEPNSAVQFLELLRQSRSRT